MEQMVLPLRYIEEVPDNRIERIKFDVTRLNHREVATVLTALIHEYGCPRCGKRIISYDE